MFYFDEKDLKTKDDYINQLKELKAYRNLDGALFNFGNGNMRNDEEYHLGSEDAYLEMDIQELEDIIDNWEYNKIRKNRKNRYKLNKHLRNKITYNKLNKLSKLCWWAVGRDKPYKRYWLDSKQYRKIGNSIVRNRNDFSLKCGGYRRVYDLWWEIF